jgi:predicted MFS family arabinose efflux permease
MAFLDPLRPIFRVLGHPTYRVYAVGNFTSLIGTWMQRIAIGWATWELTESGAWLGIIAFADLCPSLLFGPLAGAIVDRHDRLILVRIMQTLLMLNATALAALSFTGHLTIWVLLGISLWQGIVTSFSQPARLSLVSNLISAADLPTAIAINSITFNTARFIGPVVAGAVIVAGGPAWCFAGNSATYLVFLVALFVITPVGATRVARPGSGPRQGMIAEILAGFAYARTHAGIGPLLVLMIVSSVCVRPVVELLPGYAGDVFARGAEGLALLTAAVGIGAVVGGLWLAGRSKLTGLTAVSNFAGLAMSVVMLLFAATQDFALGIAALALGGAALTGNGVSSQTLLQSASAPHMRGRVLSLYGVMFRGGPAVGALLMGIASEWVGLQWPLAVGAVASTIAFAVAIPKQARMAKSLEQPPSA